MQELSDRLMHWLLIFLVQVRPRAEVLRTPNSTRLEFKTSLALYHLCGPAIDLESILLVSYYLSFCGIIIATLLKEAMLSVAYLYMYLYHMQIVHTLL